MLQPSDEITLQKRGISSLQIEEQLKSFVTGFPFLDIQYAAENGKGIVQVSAEEIVAVLNEWESYLSTDASIIKFVPASGAASRMFKDLFEFLEKEGEGPSNAFEKKFFDEIQKFAFYKQLNAVCIQNNGKTITELIATNGHKAIVSNLLSDKGLNYGSLPKGLLQFHSYAAETRTPTEEHLVEGALYANAAGNVNIHFTVSKEHRSLFEKHLKESLQLFEQNYKVNYKVGFSEQKPSTDTIAADENNQAFRDKGELIFRPGGHGALIENLNDLEGDIIFIKNIDNVVPDSVKESTVLYKKIIAGLLVKLQKQSFSYLRELENGDISAAKLAIIAQFCEVRLNNHPSKLSSLSQDELKVYLFNKLNRPMRICGMVKNVGEPGGGPFMTVNSDGTVLRISILLIWYVR